MNEVTNRMLSQQEEIRKERSSDRDIPKLFEDWKEKFENIKNENILTIFKKRKPSDGFSFLDSEFKKTFNTSREERKK